MAEITAHYVEASDARTKESEARMNLLEDRFQALIQIIAAEHGNGKGKLPGVAEREIRVGKGGEVDGFDLGFAGGLTAAEGGALDGESVETLVGQAGELGASKRRIRQAASKTGGELAHLVEDLEIGCRQAKVLGLGRADIGDSDSITW